MRSRSFVFALASAVGSLLALLVIAAMPAVSAADEISDGPHGFIEICKTFNAGPAGSPAYQGTFTYSVYEGDSYITTVNLNAVEGGPQECTQPISVPYNSDDPYATVTEESAPWFSVASITGTQGDPGSVTTDDTTGQAVLSVNEASDWNVSQTTTVEYTNNPVTGVVEVCKQAAANSPSLTGTYNFTISSTDDGISAWDSTDSSYDSVWSTTGSATISNGGLGCSGPIIVPAGSVETVEPGDTYVTAITAVSNGEDVQTDSDLVDGTSYETVAAGNTTDQTIVTYTDALSTVKLCKEWDGDSTSTVFPFTLTSSGPAGPTAVTGSVGLEAGQCQIVGTVRAGTQVNITEGITPGTKVEGIYVDPKDNGQGDPTVVPGSLSLPNRTVSVLAGAGETDVTYVDEPAETGMLKICVAPTTNPTAGTVPFTVNGTQTIDVNLSSTAVQCTLDESSFVFDGSVTIAGGALPSPDAFAGSPTVVPTSVDVLEDGVPTATNQTSLTASTASSATVLISEGIVTEVTFTVDPPAPVTAPTVTVTAGGDTVVTGVSTPGVTAPVTITPSVTPAITPSISAKVEKLEKQLSTVKSEIKTLTKRLGSKNLSARARLADKRELAKLRTLEAKVLRELKL